SLYALLLGCFGLALRRGRLLSLCNSAFARSWGYGIPDFQHAAFASEQTRWRSLHLLNELLTILAISIQRRFHRRSHRIEENLREETDHEDHRNHRRYRNDFTDIHVRKAFVLGVVEGSKEHLLNDRQHVDGRENHAERCQR